MSTDIRGKLAIQNLRNSTAWNPKNLLIRILYESKVTWMGQSGSLDLFLSVHRHQGKAGQPELGEQHHLDPQETVNQDTLWIKSCLNGSKWQSASVSGCPKTSGVSWPARTWGTASSGPPGKRLSGYFMNQKLLELVKVTVWICFWCPQTSGGCWPART